MYNVSLYVDGLDGGGRKGPVGAGIVLKYDVYRKEISVSVGRTEWRYNHQAAEIMAATTGLQALRCPADSAVTLYTHSPLVEGILTKKWGTWAPTVDAIRVERMRRYASVCAKLEVVRVYTADGLSEHEQCCVLARRAVYMVGR